jgi:hypothetical protein
MSDTRQRQRYADTEMDSRQATAWVGMVAFAGIILVMAGGFETIQGLVALFRDEYYVVTRDGLLVTIDYTVWGWVHLIAGLVAIGTGFGILLGQMWARVLGVIIAVLGALLNLAFLAAYPIWSTIMIALDVLVIYALVAHGREVKY